MPSSREAEARARLGRLFGQFLALQDAVVSGNYGEAQALSSPFFDQVREAGAGADATARTALDAILMRRDTVTAGLARGEGSVREVLVPIERELRRALGYPVPALVPAPPAPAERLQYADADGAGMSDDLWYKDAVFYELHVKAYADANGDGMGDFPGPREPARPPEGPRRRLPLAPADVPVALPRRRLRHLRLLRRPPPVRHPRRLPGLPRAPPTSGASGSSPSWC